jgi:hypothetical protein
MFFVVLSSSSSAPFGFETSVVSPSQVEAGSYLLARNADLDDACHQSDDLSAAFSAYAQALDESGDRLFAQAVSGLTRDMIAKFEEITDRA